MQYIFIAVAIIFYIVRFISKQKKEQQEAERRRQATSNVPGPNTEAEPTLARQQQPKTIDEILTEMHRRVETQSKPYAAPSSPLTAATKPIRKEAPKPVMPLVKETINEITTSENSAYDLEIQRNMASDFIKKGELTDVYNTPKKISANGNFNIRDAVIAQIILQRPEW